MCCASPNTLRFCRRVVCALCDVLQQSAVKTSGRSELCGCASLAPSVFYPTRILCGFESPCGALRIEHAAQRQQQALPVCKLKLGKYTTQEQQLCYIYSGEPRFNYGLRRLVE